MVTFDFNVDDTVIIMSNSCLRLRLHVSTCQTSQLWTQIEGFIEKKLF